MTAFAALPTSIAEDRATLEAVSGGPGGDATSLPDNETVGDDGKVKDVTGNDVGDLDAGEHGEKTSVSLPSAECHMQMAIEW